MSRTAIVTGGAKRIGRSIVERLAREGYSIAIHYNRSAEAAEALASAIQRTGARAITVSADLACQDAAYRIMQVANNALGPVDLLVNCASEFQDDDAYTLDLDQWERHFAINLRSPIFLARDFARQLPDGVAGSIVNIIDQRVWKLTPQFFSYTLSKSALFSATKTLAQAFAPHIRVNAIGPGPTLKGERQDEDDFAKQSAAVLLRHGPLAHEIADAVVYLSRAQSVTGQMIAVDGGQHLNWETPDVVGIRE